MNNCVQERDLIIKFEEDDPEVVNIESNDINVEMDSDINVTPPVEHSELLGLDYEDAGHTGFTPSRLNLLANVSPSVSNERLNVLVNVDNVASKMTLSDLQKRIIRSVDGEMPEDLQVGQYILEKVEEDE